MVIESNLHHIPGLSENFLYLNDDIFFGNIIEKYELENNIFGEINKMSPIISPTDTSYIIGNKLNFKMLKQFYPDIQFFIPWHQGSMCKRSLMYELEKLFPLEFVELNSHRTRKADNSVSNQQDFWMIGLQQMYGLHTGVYKLKENHLSNIFVEMGGLKEFSKLKEILKTNPKFFCINNIQDPDDVLTFFKTFFV